MSQNYYVVGGEYADTSFTVAAPGTQLEVFGPFNERDAKVCWRDLTGKTVDNAMVRYFLKSEDEISGKSKTYWVVGGEYADSSFTRLQSGKELEVYGPFDEWEGALGFWRGMTSKSVDDAMMRYDIRENYQPGDGIPVRRKADEIGSMTKSVAINAPVQKVFAFLSDGANWPKWAIHNVKSVKPGKDGTWDMETTRGAGTLILKGDATSGVLDHVFVDGQGVSWPVPARVVSAGKGAVYVLTFTKPGTLTESQFTQGMRHLDDELATLKRVIESA